MITSLSVLILLFLFLPDSAECIACVADTVANLKQIRPQLGSISELTTAYSLESTTERTMKPLLD